MNRFVKIFFLTIATTLVSLCHSTVFAQVSVDLEGGYIFSIPYNVVRIPSAGGTRFDLAKDLDPNTSFAFRARVNLKLGERHILSGLYAPLEIQSEGTVDKEIIYSGKTFAANTALQAVYKFNSYRLTYRYMFISNQRFQLGFGLTGKIREANIILKSSDADADYPDLGFVPLVNFYAAYSPIRNFMIVVEGDALGTGKGRAEDVFAGLTYAISERVQAKAGYRVLEGGADVKRNYNFSWINYATAGVIIDLSKNSDR